MMFFKRKNKKDDFFRATPKFYEKEDVILGVFALTEGTDTILPKKLSYQVDDGKEIIWRLFLVSLTDQAPVGTVDYMTGLENLRKFYLHETEEDVSVRGLTDPELKHLYAICES